MVLYQSEEVIATEVHDITVFTERFCMKSCEANYVSLACCTVHILFNTKSTKKNFLHLICTIFDVCLFIFWRSKFGIDSKRKSTKSFNSLRWKRQFSVFQIKSYVTHLPQNETKFIHRGQEKKKSGKKSKPSNDRSMQINDTNRT